MDKNKKIKCPMCGVEFNEYEGNNPDPLDVDGPVCEQCNMDYVIPARLEALGLNITKAQDSKKEPLIIRVRKIKK